MFETGTEGSSDELFKYLLAICVSNANGSKWTIEVHWRQFDVAKDNP